MTIVSRFRILLAEKEVRERRTIPLKEVAEVTGVSIYTITAFANSSLRQIPVDALEALCGYFHVTPGELIERRVDVDEQIRMPYLHAIGLTHVQVGHPRQDARPIATLTCIPPHRTRMSHGVLAAQL